MKRARDTQRQKHYDAEREALWSISTPLPTVADVERYCRKTLARKRVIARWPQCGSMVDVGDGRGRRKACAIGTREIRIPLWARNDAVVLHELAHIIVNRQWRGQTLASHGWQFASVFLDLVWLCMGAEARDALKAAYKKHGVRHKAPRAKRVMSPEQKAALVARLAVARQKNIAVAQAA